MVSFLTLASAWIANVNPVRTMHVRPSPEMTSKQKSDLKNKENRIKKISASATAAEYSRSNNDERSSYKQVKHITNRTTRTSQAKSQTKPRKAVSKQAIRSQINTETHSSATPPLYTSQVTETRLHRKGVSTNDISAQRSFDSPTKIQSGAVMNEIDPSLQRHPSLLPQLLYSDLECQGRSLVIWHAILIVLVRENCFVEMLR